MIIIRKDLAKQLSKEVCETIQPTSTKLVTVTGEVTPFYGKTVLNTEIGKQNLQHKVLLAELTMTESLVWSFLLLVTVTLC